MNKQLPALNADSPGKVEISEGAYSFTDPLVHKKATDI